MKKNYQFNYISVSIKTTTNMQIPAWGVGGHLYYSQYTHAVSKR